MNRIPNPDTVFPNEYGTSCFLKNVITAPNIFVGDYTYYDDSATPADFEKNNVLFNWPEFGDRLIIGKFCCIASGARFIMGSANHRMCSVTTYPFNVFGGAWAESTPPHLSTFCSPYSLLSVYFQFREYYARTFFLIVFFKHGRNGHSRKQCHSTISLSALALYLLKGRVALAIHHTLYVV